MKRDCMKYEILNHHISLKKNGDDDHLAAASVECVQTKVNRLLKEQPQLNSSQIFLLVALEIAKEFQEFKNFTSSEIQKIESSTLGAFEIIHDLLNSSSNSPNEQATRDQTTSDQTKSQNIFSSTHI
jgi:cell division protein ZapA (FtsZ GTPase activity inhibitor)